MTIQRIFFYGILTLLSTLPAVFGQTKDSLAPPPGSTVGLEIDALPYLSGGYYGSVWYGIEHFRFRGVITKTTVPEFILPEGYKKNNLKVTAVIADYFPKEGFHGWWIGSGIEFWKSTIEHDKETAVSSYSNTVFTLGAGYVWKFFRNFYLNPWGGVHIPIAGDTEVPVGSRTFKPAFLTGEVSLKLGWHF